MAPDLAYAGFWARLRAGIVDFLIFVPLIPLSFWSLGKGPSEAAAVYVASSLVYFAYAIIGHAVWGQTVGKRLVGITVTDLTGESIGWKRAWRRSAVDIGLGAISAATYFATLQQIPASEFAALGWVEIQQRYDAIRPWWAAGAEYLYWAWLGSEIISVLFNRRRRALHDFIAGTAVIHVALSPAEGRPQIPVTSRALVWANGIVAAASAALAALSFLGAMAAMGTNAPDDNNARTGFLVIAVATCVVGLGFAAAARAFHRTFPKRWAMQGLALGLAVLVALPFLM